VTLSEFLSLLETAAQAVEEAERGGSVSVAKEALAAAREHFGSLSQAERQAALPLAKQLAERLASAEAGTDVFLPTPTGGPGLDQEALDLLGQAPLRFYRGGPDPDALLSWFGYDQFRPGQREAVEAALAGRDSMVVMPTGGGKSLCYQLPGMASDRLTVVVSPLVALIADQYSRLRQDGHPAVMLASEHDNLASLQSIRRGEARIVFAAPERFASRAFLDALSSRELGLFAVDEAHCISEWGHDFRPDYLRLRQVVEQLGRPTVMAATATATPEVQEEIIARLGLERPEIVRGAFDRPNISFDVIDLSGKGAVARKRQLLLSGLHLLANRPAIVYCGTRKDVDAVAELLQQSGLQAAAYHAGLGYETRQDAQTGFMEGRYEVIVATNAFGMGVDKADVRSVWHWALPTSLEAYYQEAGRAGRDGLPARAVLLSLRADLGRLINFNKRRSTDVETVALALAGLKRRAVNDQVELEPPLDDELRLALAIAERSGAVSLSPGRSGQALVSFLGPLNRQKAHAACQVAKEHGWQAYRAVGRRQLLEHFSDPTPPNPQGRCCSVCDPLDWLPALDEPLPAPAPRKRKATQQKSLADGSGPLRQAELTGELAEQLKDWRKQRAGNLPAYTVCQNATLQAIIELRPRSKDHLKTIKGVGPGFLAKHADSLLGLLAAQR
jgi:RecQ family ATP-dependent DNA helicase